MKIRAGIAVLVVAAMAAVAQMAGAAATVERFTIPFTFYAACTGEVLGGTADVLSVSDFSRESDPTHPFLHLAQTYTFSLTGVNSGIGYSGTAHMTEVFSGRFFGDTESEAFVEPITIVLRSSQGPNLIFKSRTVTVVTPNADLTVNIDQESTQCV